MTRRSQTDRSIPAHLLRLLAGTAMLLQASAAQSASGLPQDTLAVVGSCVITAADFSSVYTELVRTTGLTDNLQSRREVLRNLIEDRVLIEHAKCTGLDRTPEALKERGRLETQELLNGFVRSRIMPRVEVSDDDLRTLYVRLNTKLRVRHLYAPTRDEADALFRRLASGATMDALAKEVFSDPWLREHGGSLGYITIDEMDPSFERVAFSLGVGETSQPVKTAHGYSIIRVEEIVRNPLTTETEFARAKERLQRYAAKRAFEEALRSYTASLRIGLHVRIEEDIVRRLIGGQAPAGPASIAEPGFSAEDLRTIAVRSDVVTWTAGALLEILENVPDAHRRWVRSAEDLTDMIAGLVLREYVRQEAVAMRLHETPAFRVHVSQAFDTYLLSAAEALLKAEIAFPEDAVQRYYAQNLSVFSAPAQVRLAGILVETPETAGRVREALNAGEDFGTVARTHSVQRATAERDGDMGLFTRDQLGHLGDVCMALREGEWKGPFEEDGSFLFVRRIGWREGGARPLEDCRQEIETILVSGAWRAHRTARTEEMRSSVPVMSFPERLSSVTLASSVTP